MAFQPASTVCHVVTVYLLCLRLYIFSHFNHMKSVESYILIYLNAWDFYFTLVVSKILESLFAHKLIKLVLIQCNANLSYANTV